MKLIAFTFALTGCGLSLQGEDLPQIDSGPQIAAEQEPTREAGARAETKPEAAAVEADAPEAAVEGGVTDASSEASTADAANTETSTAEASVVEAAAPEASVDAAIPTDAITFCLGCLDDRGVCYAGNMTTACGKNGQKCMDCTTAGLQHVCGIPNYVCL